MSSVKRSIPMAVQSLKKNRYLFLLFCCLSICKVHAQVFEQTIGYSYHGIVNRPVAIFSDAGDQTIYVVDEQTHKVLRYTNGGQVTLTFGGYGTENGKFRNPAGIAQRDSKIYVVDSGNHRVQVFNAGDGSFLFSFGSEGSADGQFNNPKGIFIDDYNQVMVVDQGNARIQIFNHFNGGFIRKFGTYGSGNSQFNNPVDVFADNVSFQQRIYVSDAGNNRVQYFDYAGTYQGQFGSYGSGNGQFNNPTGVVTGILNSSLAVYVADSGNKRVQVFSTEGVYKGVIGSAGTGDGQFNAVSDLSTSYAGIKACDPVNGTISSFTGGNVTLPTYSSKFGQDASYNGWLYYPQNMTRHENMIYVADKNNKRIQMFNATYGSTYESKFAQGYAIGGIAIDENAKVYATNPEGNTVRVYNSIGTFQYEMGTSGSGPGQLNTPGDVVVVKSGVNNFVYVLDKGNYRVQVFNASTGIPVRNFGSQGTGNGQFTTPNGICADASGKIYVAEEHRIQVFDNTGNWLKTIVGAGQGSGNGQFDGIQDVAVDASGNIYVTESNNNRIQLLTGEGVFIRKFGTFGFGNGEFNSPAGIFLYGNQIYVADQLNHRLQVLQAKPAPEINFSNFTRTFGEAPFGLNATTNSTGAITYSVQLGGTGYVSLDGNTVTLVQAGIVNLRASVAEDANYKAGYKDVQLTINKGAAQLMLSNLQHQYDNTGKSATVTTIPAGLEGVRIRYIKDGVYYYYPPSAVGHYAIEAWLENLNYTAPLATGTLSIIGKPAASITNFGNITKTYGDAPFTLNATSNSTGAITYTAFSNTGEALISNNTVTIAKAGTVRLQVNVAEDANFAATTLQATLFINKAALIITAHNKTRVYGEDNPPYTWSIDGFKNGEDYSVIDNQPFIVTTAHRGSPVGTYPIRLAGATDNNYLFSYVDGTLIVTKARLTITADDKTRFYGDTNPTLTVTYEGFRNGDTEAQLTSMPVATTTATQESNADNYAIVTAGASAVNYEITHGNGTLSVLRAPLDSKTDDQRRKYGEANPEFTIRYGGFKNDDSPEDLDVEASATTMADERTDVGVYAIVISGGSDNNYEFSGFSNGFLTIEQASQTISFPPIDDKNVNDKDFEIGAAASSGLEIAYTVSGPAMLVERTKISLTGKTGIVTVRANQAGDHNYEAATEVVRVFNVDDKPSQTIPLTDLPGTADGVASVYPNPAKDRVVVETQEAANGSTVRVIDMHGRTMNAPAFEVDEYIHTVDVSQLPAGLYHIQVSKGRRIITTQRIVKIN